MTRNRSDSAARRKAYDGVRYSALGLTRFSTVTTRTVEAGTWLAITSGDDVEAGACVASRSASCSFRSGQIRSTGIPRPRMLPLASARGAWATRPTSRPLASTIGPPPGPRETAAEWTNRPPISGRAGETTFPCITSAFAPDKGPPTRMAASTSTPAAGIAAATGRGAVARSSHFRRVTGGSSSDAISIAGSLRPLKAGRAAACCPQECPDSEA